MTRMTQLSIKNFRGFDSLEINDFSKVNLFVGKNNSGKTSILESIFLTSGMSNPLLPNLINQIRGVNAQTAKQNCYLFHNLDIKNGPLFSAKFSDISERLLKLEAKYKSNEIPNYKLNKLPNSNSNELPNNNSNELPSNNSSTAIPNLELIGLDLIFQEKKDGTQHINDKSSFIFGNAPNPLTIPGGYNERFIAYFLTERDDAGTFLRLSEIIKRKEEKSILEILQNFDDSILDIKTLRDGIYFSIKDIEELIPINILGDGIRRFLCIATAVSERKDSFVCIDEIENGLHYSAYRLLWKSLLSFSEQNNVQLFITTHNIETLTCLKSVLEEKQFESMQKDAKVFTVSKTKKRGFQTYGYSFEGFKSAIDHENEMRD